MKTVVLVYSGGLDTSVCIPLMKEEYGYDKVVTVTVDVGQPNPMWQFVDAADYTAEIPEGLREAALGGPSEDDDIPF